MHGPGDPPKDSPGYIYPQTNTIASLSLCTCRCVVPSRAIHAYMSSCTSNLQFARELPQERVAMAREALLSQCSWSRSLKFRAPVFAHPQRRDIIHIQISSRTRPPDLELPTLY